MAVLTTVWNCANISKFAISEAGMKDDIRIVKGIL
jgi:hypothetical protein